MAWERSGRQRARDRAVGVVEYALVLSIVVIGALGAIQSLEDKTGDEVANQADCLSTRPPPPSCQAQPLAPTTTAGGGGTTTTMVGGGGTTETAEIQQASPPFTATGGGLLTVFDVSVDLTLLNDDTGAAVTGEIVSVKVTVTGSFASIRNGNFFFAECVTDDNGLCELDFDSRWIEVTELTYEVVSVGVDTPFEFDEFTPVVVTDPSIP